eukprot:6936442-Ditylum_brightwellii.AAC.1
MKPPEFCCSKTVQVTAHVEDNTQGHHDIILRTKYCGLLGLNFDFKERVVTWDDVSLKMKQHGELQSPMLNAVHPINVSLPPSIQVHLNAHSRTRIGANTYDKHNINDMIW